jgi:hypothetical protein
VRWGSFWRETVTGPPLDPNTTPQRRWNWAPNVPVRWMSNAVPATNTSREASITAYSASPFPPLCPSRSRALDNADTRDARLMLPLHCTDRLRSFLSQHQCLLTFSNVKTHRGLCTVYRASTPRCLCRKEPSAQAIGHRSSCRLYSAVFFLRSQPLSSPLHSNPRTSFFLPRLSPNLESSICPHCYVRLCTRL